MVMWRRWLERCGNLASIGCSPPAIAARRISLWRWWPDGCCILEANFSLSRLLDTGSRASTLPQVLDVEGADENELYAAMDWLVARQGKIEDALAKRHLTHGCLVLYDVSSSYFEGKACPLARLDLRGDRMQITYGLLCNAE